MTSEVKEKTSARGGGIRAWLSAGWHCMWSINVRLAIPITHQLSNGKRKERTQQEKDEAEGGKRQHQPPNISPLQPLTVNAYGGGMYGTEEGQLKDPTKPPASATQSADGPDKVTPRPKHKPPPSTGDKDLDITGQSYIQ
ncbi:uncharacterized protein [Primulina huaijiensis]|uniref:uncharacterized protein n=1 Tax=Primulina huaijiensis TaxID=1492673 RepID=UPI003CC7547A